MTTLYSDLISIPGLALTDAVVTVVPKTTGQTWTANADPLLSTPVRYDAATGKFVSSSADEAIGYTAISAASGDTTATVALLPFAVYSGGFHGPTDTGQWNDPGNYMVSARQMPQQVNKLASEAWVLNNTIYWDATNGVATRVSTGNVQIGSAAAAAGLGTTIGLYYCFYSFREFHSFDSPNVERNGTRPLRKKAATVIAAGQQLSMDEDGDHYPTSTVAHGIVKRATAAAAAAAGTTEVKATLYDSAAGKIWFTYKQMLIAAQKQQTALIMPKLAAAEEINNSYSQEVYANSPSAGVSIDYSYIYKVQPYKLLRTIFFGPLLTGATAARIMNVTDSFPPLSFAIPSSLSWTPSVPNPSPFYAPPGAVDLSATHRLVFEGTWSIYKIAGNAGTHDPGLYANKPKVNYSSLVTTQPLIRTSDGKWTTFNPPHFGKSNGQTYVIDPTRRFVFSYVFFENTSGPSAGSLRLDYSVVRAEADGSETTLRAYTTIPRSTWYTGGGLAYIRFDLDLSLSDLGEASPLMRYQTDYTIKFRQYHSSVSPYNSFAAQWGSLGFSGLNVAGSAVNYGGRLSYYQRDHAYFYSAMPYRLRRSDGAEWVTDHIQAAIYPPFTYEPAWTGSLVMNTAVVDANRVRVSFVSTLTPDTTAANLTGNATGSTLIRIRRLSDGLWMHTYVNQFSTPAGCKWSPSAALGTPTYSATSNGSGKNGGYRTGYTTHGYWIDKAPSAASESFEIEVLTYGLGNFSDSGQRYFSRRDVFTLTI